MKKEYREIRICGDLAYIPLTQGYTAIVDAADVDLLKLHSWYAVSGRPCVYAAAKIKVNGLRKMVRLHKFLMSPPEGSDVDHIDLDGLNNRRSNLRIATRSQNMQNQSMRKDNTSGYRGVFWRKDYSKWSSCITKMGVRMNLGFFENKEDAHKAYVCASERLFGAYGNPFAKPRDPAMRVFEDYREAEQ